jgi:hypothetical protein
VSNPEPGPSLPQNKTFFRFSCQSKKSYTSKSKKTLYDIKTFFTISSSAKTKFHSFIKDFNRKRKRYNGKKD